MLYQFDLFFYGCVRNCCVQFYFIKTLITWAFVLTQDGATSIYTVADGSLGEWLGGFLYSAGEQANDAVRDQLSALSFTRFILHLVTSPAFVEH